MGPKLALEVPGEGAPTSLMEWAQKKQQSQGSGLSINVTADETMGTSFRVSDDGTLQLLSESCSNYHINSEGMSKASTPAAEHSPAVSDRHYNCRSSEIEKMQLLGRGASGTVYKGLHRPSKTLVAVKEVNAMDKVSRDQMLNEVRTLCDLPELEGLVKFYGAFYTQEEGRISIIIEYMNAGNLEDLVQKLPGKRFPEHILSAICGKILTGLRYLHEHRSLVHRDIKPANLLMNLNGEPKITDFGISSSLIDKENCQTNVGTFQYMSPERLGNLPYSFASDIWAIGLCILELAIGEYPYQNAAPVPFILEVTTGEAPLPPAGEYSEELRDFVGLCMEKDPDDRPSAVALLNHPWILKHRAACAELNSFVCSIIPDSQQRIAEDAALTR